MTDQPLHPRIVEQTTKNLALSRQFLDDVLEDDSVLDDIPEGTKLILIPLDDPELGQMNFEMAVHEMMQGHKVVMRRVGGLTPEAEAWRVADVRHLFMHEIKFPTTDLHASDVKIVWDQERDTLLVDYFSGRDIEVKWLEVGPHIMLRVDTQSHEIAGYLISSFFQLEALHSAALLRAFRMADIRAITDEELGNNDIAIVREGETPFDDNEAAAVATAFLTILAPPRKSGETPRMRDSA